MEDDDWKTVEVFLPCTLNAHEVRARDRAYSTIRVIASAARELGDRGRLGAGIT